MSSQWRAPALAIARGVQQTVDQILVGVGTWVAEEFAGFCGSGRQAREVEGDAADQVAGGGGELFSRRIWSQCSNTSASPVTTTKFWCSMRLTKKGPF